MVAMMGLDMVNSMLPSENWTGFLIRIVVYLWLLYLWFSKVLIEVGFQGFLEADSWETGTQKGMEWWRLACCVKVCRASSYGYGSVTVGK